MLCVATAYRSCALVAFKPILLCRLRACSSRLSAATDRAAFHQLVRQLFLGAWDVFSRNIFSIVTGNQEPYWYHRSPFQIVCDHCKEPSSDLLLSFSQRVIVLLHV
jgi:hypothetical protein